MIVQIVNTGSTFMLYLMESDRLEFFLDVKEKFEKGIPIHWSQIISDKEYLDAAQAYVEDVECAVEDRYEVDYLIDASGRIEKKMSIIAPRPLNIARDLGILYPDRIDFYRDDQLKITWPIKYFFISGTFYVKEPLMQ